MSDGARAVVRDLLEYLLLRLLLSGRWLAATTCRRFRSATIGGVLLRGLSLVRDRLLPFDLDQLPVPEVASIDLREADLLGRWVNRDPVEFDLQIVTTFLHNLEVDLEVTGARGRPRSFTLLQV